MVVVARRTQARPQPGALLLVAVLAEQAVLQQLTARQVHSPAAAEEAHRVAVTPALAALAASA